MRSQTLMQLLAGAVFGVAPVLAQTPAPAPDPFADPRPAEARPARQDPFEGFDFGQVLKRIEASVDPLQTEMHASFKDFGAAVEESDQLLKQGQVKPAIEKAVVAIDGVLLVKDKVLGPMWEGQTYLNEQAQKVRDRLARAMEIDQGAPGKAVKLDQATENVLDRIATSIVAEKDPWRSRRLVAHYRAVRQMAEIRTMASKLSPDQRKLWMSVLQVLQEASNTHFQLMLGSETLFAQFEATKANLEGYLTLLETLKGAGDVLGAVRGTDDANAGIATISAKLEQLQTNLADLGGSMDSIVRTQMADLEGRIDAIQQERGMNAPAGAENAAAGIDDELRNRIDKVSGRSAKADK